MICERSRIQKCVKGPFVREQRRRWHLTFEILVFRISCVAIAILNDVGDGMLEVNSKFLCYTHENVGFCIEVTTKQIPSLSATWIYQKRVVTFTYCLVCTKLAIVLSLSGYLRTRVTDVAAVAAAMLCNSVVRFATSSLALLPKRRVDAHVWQSDWNALTPLMRIFSSWNLPE